MPANSNPSKPKSQHKQARALFQKEVVKARKMTEIPTEDYYPLLKRALRYDAMVRREVARDGWHDESFDPEYDDACIQELPTHLLD